MNWYKKAQESFSALNFEDLLDWISGPIIKSAQVGRGSRGHTRNILTEDQKDIIKEMYTEGVSQTAIAQNVGVSPAIVRNYLIRSGAISQNTGTRGTTGKGLGTDQQFINKVKKLRKTTNPNTGKLYNKSQIARELGVSYQTIDRAVAFYDPQTPNELANYVSYRFWNQYSSGISNKIRDIPESERYDFVSGFIDTLFKNPQDKASAKEAVFQKLKIRNEMVEGPNTVGPATQLVESPYNPDFAPGEPDPMNPKVPEPMRSGVWRRKQRQRQRGQIIDPQERIEVPQQQEEAVYALHRIIKKHAS